jgi:hypothetical protein
MGEGTTRINGDGEPTPRDLENEIDEIRTDLDGLVGELDRRRHDALDWRLQVRRHQRGLAIALVAGVGSIALAVLMLRSARRRREAPMNRAVALLHALQLVAREPETLERALESQRSHPTRTAAKVAGSAGGALFRAGLARAAQSP